MFFSENHTRKKKWKTNERRKKKLITKRKRENEIDDHLPINPCFRYNQRAKCHSNNIVTSCYLVFKRIRAVFGVDQILGAQLIFWMKSADSFPTSQHSTLVLTQHRQEKNTNRINFLRPTHNPQIFMPFDLWLERVLEFFFSLLLFLLLLRSCWCWSYYCFSHALFSNCTTPNIVDFFVYSLLRSLFWFLTSKLMIIDSSHPKAFLNDKTVKFSYSQLICSLLDCKTDAIKF